MSLILALDQGTTTTKAFAVNHDREIVARAGVPTPLEHPEAGWAQNDPEEILDATLEVLGDVLEAADPDAVEALGITNQRETALAWEASSGDPLAPAVSWQCRRTEPICREVRADEELAGRIRDRTGLVVDPYFSATKWRWMLDEIDAVSHAEAIGDLSLGTVDAFLVEALTGEHATDPSNASRTMVYDLHEGAWSPELSQALGIPLEALPAIVPSSGVVGEIDASTRLGSHLTELEGVPVAGIAGDQQASLFGHGCLEPGQAKATLGTGAFLLANTGDEVLEPAEGILATTAWDLGDGCTYAVEGSAFACGSVLEWASGLGWLDGPDALDETAAPAEDNRGAVFVPALYGLSAPDWDPDAQAALMGLSTSVGREHVALAIAEGLAAQNTRLLEALAACGQPLDEVRLDGGVSGSDLVCQLMADAAGRAMHRSPESQLTALGAAGLAGLAVGRWELEDLQGGPSQAFEPQGKAAFMQRYRDAVDAVRS